MDWKNEKAELEMQQGTKHIMEEARKRKIAEVREANMKKWDGLIEEGDLAEYLDHSGPDVKSVAKYLFTWFVNNDYATPEKLEF